MAFLVDTNVLVYRFDPRFPEKQKRATELLRNGILAGEAYVPHQAVVEFVSATSRPIAADQPALLTPDEARREAEDLISQFSVLYPVEGLLRLAIRGWATYKLNWFDAHLWAYAEYYNLPLLYSEDFQHERMYGTVRAVNPFA